jgi:hypothetical protein
MHPLLDDLTIMNDNDLIRLTSWGKLVFVALRVFTYQILHCQTKEGTQKRSQFSLSRSEN